MERMNLAGRLIEPDGPPYIIAEIGSNHNGDMRLCRELIDAALESGADAVKFQSWTKDSLVSKAEYSRNTSYADKKRHFGSLEEMVVRYQLTPMQHNELAGYCRERGIEFLSSCFGPAEVDLLESLNVPAHKIASMDINHLSLLKYVAQTRKPIIISTGMATLGEIETAVSVLKENGAGAVALLHCVSIYPPEYSEINLRNIPMLQQAFDLPVGFSDHTMGVAIPLAAIALGACILEKHFTLDRQMEGWDHWISATPSELKIIVDESRNVRLALGTSRREISASEVAKRKKFRRRMVAKRAFSKGHRLTTSDVEFKRPGTGISPDELEYAVGRSLNRDVTADEEIEWSDLL